MALTVFERFSGSGGNVGTNPWTFISSSANFSASSWAVLFMGVDNSAADGGLNSSFAITDSVGNTWTRRTSRYNLGTGQNNGVEGAIFTTTQNVGPITTATAITASLGTAVGSRVWTLYEVRHQANGITLITASNGNSATSNNASVTTGEISPGQVVLAGAFVEQGTNITITPDSDTLSGSWSTALIAATTGAAAGGGGQSMISQYKIVEGNGGTQTYNASWAFGQDWVNSFIVLGEIPYPSEFFYILK